MDLVPDLHSAADHFDFSADMSEIFDAEKNDGSRPPDGPASSDAPADKSELSN